jgi:hypothetical protein
MLFNRVFFPGPSHKRGFSGHRQRVTLTGMHRSRHTHGTQGVGHLEGKPIASKRRKSIDYAINKASLLSNATPEDSQQMLMFSRTSGNWLRVRACGESKRIVSEEKKAGWVSYQPRCYHSDSDRG